MADAEDAPDGDGGVEVTMDVEERRTLISVTGEREAAVIVESASGERIYLPPEEFGEPLGEARTPYDSPYDASAGGETPYEGGLGGSSPYESAEDAGPPTETVGVTATGDGFQVLHPEPVTDVRLLR